MTTPLPTTARHLPPPRRQSTRARRIFGGAAVASAILALLGAVFGWLIGGWWEGLLTATICGVLGFLFDLPVMVALQSLAETADPHAATHCPVCNYCLVGQTTPRCPECGTDIEPDAWTILEELRRSEDMQ